MDIFPYDILPDDEKQAAAFKLQVRKNGAIKSSFKAKLTSNRWRAVLVKAILYTPEILYHRLRFGTMQRRLEATKKLSCKYEQTAGKNCAFIASKYGDKDTLPIEIFQQFNKVTFEGKEYQTLFDIKDYLLQMYGSFKPEKSHPTHDYYQFYWKKK